MNIAQVAPLIESVPPEKYGGTERVVSFLTEELVRMGHRVTLFASGDSVTKAELVPIVKHSLRHDQRFHGVDLPHLIMVEKVLRRAAEFDVIHFHSGTIQMPAIREIVDKTLTTVHGRLDLPDIQEFYSEFQHVPLVSISDAQRKPVPTCRWMGTVYNGIDKDHYKLRPKSGDYVAFLGRISPEKRPDLAIAIAKRARFKLKMAAKVDPADRLYFETKIKPLLATPFVEYMGEIPNEDKERFLNNASALLFPIDWPEPFGMVMIEAMACGTPVIAFDRGSVREVIEDGITGFIVNSIEEAAAALQKIDGLDPALIRRRFEERFTATSMAKGYLDVYRRLLDRAPRPGKTLLRSQKLEL